MLNLRENLFLCFVSFLFVGCTSYGDHKTNTLLKNKIGHPLNELVAQIGQPESSIWDISASEKTYMHTWTIQKYARDKFVKTGTEYVGTGMVGMTQGGNGVAAAPIYQDQYRDVGYNTPTYYTCMINVYTNANGIIVKEGGLKNKTNAVGGFCDEFLKLK
ncbi:hypothetical protein [Acinetobacter proteolyticus]|nr:hypothetical protein FPL18_10855 [Acinetobacter gyllenbergii]